MCDLVGYGSSDNEEDRSPRMLEPQGAVASASSHRDSPQTTQSAAPLPGNIRESTTIDRERQASASKANLLHSTLIGPQAPPTDRLESYGLTSRLSPYSAKRATIRNLTLPTEVDLSIPPSPSGSPPPGILHKFEQFSQLKYQGMHFNGKLAGSSALKNPMLLQKLMSSAGLTESDQYATTLPKDLWDPIAFPAWAYKEELARSQQIITSRKEDENARTRRDCVDFVPASNRGGRGL